VTLKEASVFSVADAEQLFPGFSERPYTGTGCKSLTIVIYVIVPTMQAFQHVTNE
jgi:hypothetical protein